MIQGARRLTGPAAPAHRRLTRINAGALRRANPAQPALRRSVVVASPGDHMSAFEQTARFLRSALQGGFVHIETTAQATRLCLTGLEARTPRAALEHAKLGDGPGQPHGGRSHLLAFPHADQRRIEIGRAHV